MLQNAPRADHVVEGLERDLFVQLGLLLGWVEKDEVCFGGGRNTAAILFNKTHELLFQSAANRSSMDMEFEPLEWLVDTPLNLWRTQVGQEP